MARLPIRLAPCAIVIATSLGLDVASTPPMGFNSWTSLGPTVSADTLKAVAQTMHDNGMLAAGYSYVNSDDDWAERYRDASGRQVPNATRFPQGWAPVCAFIHSLGMKCGLYTSKSQWTCAGLNASCGKEVVDAATYASWGVDYVKEDSCGSCRNNDTLDYTVMWQAIQATGRPMVLTTEGNPNNTACSVIGGCGNAKRVGHDIGDNWNNVQSLIDIGSGLWPFAHNATNFGGWWNDLDMMQVSRGDFVCAADAPNLARCRAHFTMWCIMKAPLLTGADPTNFSAADIVVLTDSDAIAINQDPLGIQGRRVAVFEPRNATLTDAPGGRDNIAVVRRCNSSILTQRWTFNTSRLPPGPPTQLYEAPCNASNVAQNWTFVADGTLRAGGQCVTANVGAGCLAALKVAACVPGEITQQWKLLPGGQIASGSSPGQCFDIPFGTGPQVAMCSCRPPGTATNQEWTQESQGGALLSRSAANSCLQLSVPHAGLLSTTDSAGATWCLHGAGGTEGGWIGIPCSPANNPLFFSPVVQGSPGQGPHNYTLVPTNGFSGPGWNMQQGASGPWPHSRYLASRDNVFTLDLDSSTTTIQAADSLTIIDDDLVGNVTIGGAFCLDLVTGGTLEVWVAPLVGGRWAAALFNRSPAPDTITLDWGVLEGVPPSAVFDVRDVWAGADRGAFSGSYTASEVDSHGVVLLILSPTRSGSGSAAAA